MSVMLRDAAPPRGLPAIAPIMSIRELVAIAFRNRGKILLALIIPPVIAVALILVLPKSYRAQTDLLVKNGREYLAVGDTEAGQSAPTSTKQESINSEIELLTSRPVIAETIKNIGLAKLYPDLLEDPPSNMSVQDAAIQQFNTDLGVEPVKMSNVISVSFDAPSAQKADMVLDQLVKTYITKHTEVFADSRTAGYEDSIKSVTAEIARLEAQRTKIKLDNGVFDIAAQRSALINQRVEGLSHLQDVTTNQATLQARINYLSGMLPKLPQTVRTVTTDKSDESIHAREAMTDLRQQEASLSARYSDNNPDLARVRAQISSLQHSLSSTSDTRANTSAAPSPLYQQVQQDLVMSTAELQPLQAEITRYQGILARYDTELRRLEQADLDLRTIGIQIDSLNDNLKTIQARYEAARTEEQTELARQVSVVQVAPAMAPDKAAKPKKILFLAGGVLGGLFLAGATLVLCVLTNKTLLTEDAAERLVGLPVLVALPMVGRRSGVVRPELE